MYFVFNRVLHEGDEIEEYLIKLENIDEVYYDNDSHTLYVKCDNYESDIVVEFDKLKDCAKAFDQVKKYCLSLNSTIIGLK